MRRVWGIAGALGLLVAIASPSIAQTQCIANVAAQGTPDAITSAQLPCGTTTNLVILTAAAANTTTTPTYAPVGSPPLTITRSTGGALQVGDLQSGYVALLTSTGTSWVLLNPAQVSGFVGLTPSSTSISPKTNGGVLWDNNGVLGDSITLPGGLIAPNFNITGAFVAPGLVTNSDLTHSATTVNGQSCVLGGTCTISTVATSIAPGTTTISPSTSGGLLWDNAGVLGDSTTLPGGVTVPWTQVGSTPTTLSGYGITDAGTVKSVGETFTGGLISVANSPITTSGTLALTVAGTSGGVPYFASNSTWASSGALTANMPVIGGGVGAAPSVGSVSGNTTKFVTTTGALTATHCVDIDGNSNFVDSGAPCPVVNSSSVGYAAYYSGASVISGETLSALIDASLGSTQGSILYRSSTIWAPLTPGTSGWFLSTQGASANPIWAPAAGGSGCVTGGVSGDILLSNGLGGCATNTNAILSNGALALGSSGVPGSVAMGNNGSGVVTLEPIQSTALGTITEYLPVASGDTLAALAATQTLTNKSIAGSEINSGTVAATYLAAITLSASGNGGVTGVLPAANGGTACTSPSITCFNNITGFSANGTTGTTSAALVFSASPTFTGTPAAPTQTTADTSTDIATDAFVHNAVNASIPTALPPNGSASGDLSGSYPGPTVAKVQGLAYKYGAAYTSGQVPVWNSTNNDFEPGSPSGASTVSVSSNLLTNTQWQVASAWGPSSKENSQGTGTENNVAVTSFTTGVNNTTFYTANTQVLKVGDDIYFNTGDAALRSAPMRVVAVNPNVSFNAWLPFQNTAVTSSATTAFPIMVGDIAGSTGAGPDGWNKTPSLLAWRDDFTVNIPPGAIYSLGMRKGTTSAENVTYGLPPVKMHSVAGRNVVFGGYVYQKVQGGTGTWTLCIYTPQSGSTCSTNGTGSSVGGFEWREVTATIPANATAVVFQMVTNGTTGDIYYLGDPEATYGTSLGIGNYIQNPNETINFVVHVNPPSLTPWTNFTFPFTGFGGSTDYGWELDIEAITNTIISRTVTSVNSGAELTTPIAGVFLGETNYLGAPQIFGMEMKSQVAGVMIPAYSQNWIIDNCSNGCLYSQGYFGLYSGAGSPTVTNLTVDMSGAVLN